MGSRDRSAGRGAGAGPGGWAGGRRFGAAAGGSTINLGARGGRPPRARDSERDMGVLRTERSNQKGVIRPDPCRDTRARGRSAVRKNSGSVEHGAPRGQGPGRCAQPHEVRADRARPVHTWTSHARHTKRPPHPPATDFPPRPPSRPGIPAHHPGPAPAPVPALLSRLAISVRHPDPFPRCYLGSAPALLSRLGTRAAISARCLACYLGSVPGLLSRLGTRAAISARYPACYPGPAQSPGFRSAPSAGGYAVRDKPSRSMPSTSA